MRNFALLFMGLLSLPTYALTQVDLYRSEIVINNEEKDAETVARVQGLQQVIVRATGSTVALENEVVRKALRQSAQYLTQMGYGELDQQQTLKMSFNGPQLRALLTQAQLPYWPESRANILVWLVEEQNYDRIISWEHSPSALITSIREQADARGLPITVPVGDFDDITGIAVSDLWGGFVSPISLASQRYPVDAVLVLRAQGNSLRWTLYDQQPAAISASPRSPVFGQENGSVSEISAQLIDQVSQYYATKSAVNVASESSESVLAQFINIKSAVSFFHLENQLKSLNSVASIDILKIQGDEVTFRVHLLTSKSEFEQEMTNIKQVAAFTSESDVVETAPVLTQEMTDQSTSLAQETLPQTAVVESAVVATHDNEAFIADQVSLTEDVQPSEPVIVFEWIDR